jgi:hypothetical protein
MTQQSSNWKMIFPTEKKKKEKEKWYFLCKIDYDIKRISGLTIRNLKKRC